MNVRFFGGRKEEYVSIPKHNPIGLYFCADTRELFLGDKLLSDGLRVVPTFADLPSIIEHKAAEGVIYFVVETKNGYVLPRGGSEWLQVIYAPETENSSVKTISFAGIEMEEADGIFTIDRRSARTALGFIVPEGTEDEELIIATEDFVKDEIAKIDIPEVSLEDYYTKSETDTAIASAIDDIKIPEIDLSDYATKDEIKNLAATSYVDEQIAGIKIPSLEAYAKTSDIPTKISQLNNDAGYITDISNKADIDHKHDDLYDVKGAAEAVKNELLNGAGDAYNTLKELGDLIGANQGAIEALTTIAAGKADKEHNHSEYLTEHQDISHLATKEELPDVSKFITEIPSEYVTETELNAKGYLTQHQSLTEYAKKSELFSKDYNDLINKPAIPSIEGLATVDYVDTAISNINIPETDLANYYNKDEVNSLINGIEHPANPTKVSELENDAKYTTEQYVADAIATISPAVEEVKTKLETEVLPIVPTVQETILPTVQKVETEILPTVQELSETAATQDWVKEQVNKSVFTEDKIVVNAIGSFNSGDNVKGLTIAEIFAKLLGLPIEPEEPETPTPDVPVEPDSILEEIVTNKLSMYSVNADGTITAEDFETITFTQEEAEAAPTKSGFYQVIENGEVVECGYQDLMAINDEIYYVIALPKVIDYNTMVRMQVWNDRSQQWETSSKKLPLTCDLEVVAELCDEVGIDISHIDTELYTIWALEDTCTGSKIRYIIEEDK